MESLLQTIRVITNSVLLVFLPVYGGIVVALLTPCSAIWGSSRDRQRWREWFVLGQRGFFYEVTLQRRSGLVLFLNHFFWLTSPLWGGLCLAFFVVNDFDDEDYRDVFTGNLWLWEV